MKMAIQRLLLSLLLTLIFHAATILGDIGTAARYSAPFSPTACYGDDPTQFPPSNLFAAAGDGIWDDGASCGRQYLVRCISASSPDICVEDQTVQIVIVDYAPQAPSPPSAVGRTMVLSDQAFGTIANSAVNSISIEFLQV